METTFDFKTNDNEFYVFMSPDIILHIHRLNHSIASLYFMDKNNNRINIPNGIEVYTYEYQNTIKKSIVTPLKHEYLLCWTDDYTIELDKKSILELKNQRKWNIIETYKNL